MNNQSKNFIVDNIISYEVKASKIEVKEDEKTKLKHAEISGTLMNAEVNDNFWRIDKEDIPNLTSTFSNIKVKTEHSYGCMAIIGNTLSAFNDGKNDDILYSLKITDTIAVNKIETGTWTVDNIGVSPHLKAEKSECSICGKDIRECMHILGREYKGKLAYVTTKKPKWVEVSITDEPAYASVGAGTVDNINMASVAASINSIAKTEEKIMAEEKTLQDIQSKLEAKEQELSDMKASLEKSETELKEAGDKIIDLEAFNSKNEYEKKIVELEASIKEKDERIKEVNLKARKVELSEIISDEKLVASILSKDMTDKEFTAKKVEIEEIKKLGAKTSGTNDDGGDAQGSVAIDGEDGEKDDFKASFGESFDDTMKNLFGKKE